MAFNILHNIKSKLAEENNINNFPGVDVNSNPTLTYNFIKNNLSLLHLNCINPMLQVFPGLRITSAYRCKELNTLLGGVENSQHIYGYAIDIVSPNYSSSLLWNWCYQNLPLYHQLIWEYPERGSFTNANFDFSWIHISYVKENNPKLCSMSSKVENIHNAYINDSTIRTGNFTHNIDLADKTLL